MATETNFQWPLVNETQAGKATTVAQATSEIGASLANKVDIPVTTADVVLTDSQHNQNRYFKFTGAMTAARAVSFKGRRRDVWVEHACTGGFTITIKCGSGAGATYALVPASIKILYMDGANNAVIAPN